MPASLAASTSSSLTEVGDQQRWAISSGERSAAVGDQQPRFPGSQFSQRIGGLSTRLVN